MATTSIRTKTAKEMKEPQKSKIIALLMDYSAGVYQNKEMVDLIESILSPLPHQDGASEIKHQLEYNIHSCKVSWCPICKEHFYTEDHYHIVSNQYGASAEDAKQLRTLADWFDVYDAKNGNIGMNEVQTSLRATANRIESFQSETAKVVAEKDREIKSYEERLTKSRDECAELRKENAELIVSPHLNKKNTN